MLNIQEVCTRISDKIAEELKLETNQRAVINYGLFAIIQTAIAILATVVVGGICGVLIPSLIVSLAAVVLRKYSGGVHAKTPESCAVIGVIVSVGGALVLSIMPWTPINIVIIGVVIFGVAFFWVLKLAPVDSVAKPIKRVEKQQLLKKKSVFVLSSYMLFIIIGLLFYSLDSNENLLFYMACIYGGVAWQVFTLTKAGHIAVQKIDFFLIHIIQQIKGEKKNEKN